MNHVGIRRGILALVAACVLVHSPSSAQTPFIEKPDGPQLVQDDELLLPDGRPLPDLPVTVAGRFEDQTLGILNWKADLAVRGDEFVGRISFPDLATLPRLSVQGTRDGDILEFFIKVGKTDVAYFAGHLAGTNLVGSFDSMTGQKGNWSGLWLPDSYKVRDDAPGKGSDQGEARE